MTAIPICSKENMTRVANAFHSEFIEYNGILCILPNGQDRRLCRLTIASKNANNGCDDLWDMFIVFHYSFRHAKCQKKGSRCAIASRQNLQSACKCFLKHCTKRAILLRAAAIVTERYSLILASLHSLTHGLNAVSKEPCKCRFQRKQGPKYFRLENP